ncbi:hypothetical protein C8R47DRAFT_1318618 [Mycena vitilis]|nr:hypothetical protein C8R47DRAFT_1318618 [Mycena vitilis]
MGPLKHHLPFLLLALVASLVYLKTRIPLMGPLKTPQLRKIAVTGSNGSVGKRVVQRALEQGYHVVGIDNSAFATADGQELGSNFTFLQTDLRDYNKTLKASGFPGSCVAGASNRSSRHLPAAKQSSIWPHIRNQGITNNVVISWNVLRAAAELGINRVAQASSVNVITLVYSQQPHFDFFPIDETHPCLPDEPYGLSKVISELQADSIVRRFTDMRVASLRLHWSVPGRAYAAQNLDHTRAKNDLWGYVQEDSAADAFLLAVTHPTDKWPSASEAFFIAAPETTFDGETSELMQTYWPTVPLKEGKNMTGNAGFFDCTKAKELLGWVHNPTLGQRPGT